MSDAGVAFFFKQCGEWVPVERASEGAGKRLEKIEQWLILPVGDTFVAMKSDRCGRERSV